VPVLTCSALEPGGIDPVWKKVRAHRAGLERAGALQDLRARQEIEWMWSQVRDGLMDRVHDDPQVAALVGELEAGLRAGALTAAMAADRILSALGMEPGPGG
jgi:LAO/AO transport system kinase